MGAVVIILFMGTLIGALTRERVAVEILDVFKEQTSKWGVTVERVEVMSLCVAREMVVPMAMEAKAAREANGLVIIQQGERKCLEQIRKAADDMEDPIAIMLKYLNVMGNISTKNNKTLVVPIPKSLLRREQSSQCPLCLPPACPQCVEDQEETIMNSVSSPV